MVPFVSRGKNAVKTTVFSECSCCLGPALRSSEGRAWPGATPRVRAPSDLPRRDGEHLSPGAQGPSAGLRSPDAGTVPCRHPAVWPPSCQPLGPPGRPAPCLPQVLLPPSPLEKPLLGPSTIALPSRFFLLSPCLGFCPSSPSFVGWCSTGLGAA